MNLRTKALALTAGILLMAPVASFAGSQQSTITVGGNVISDCSTLNPSTMITLANYDVFSSSDMTGGTSYSVNCTKGSAPQVTLDGGGTSTGANGATRAMKGGASGNDLLGYNLTDGNGNAWVAGTPVTLAGLGIGSSELTTFAVNASVPHGQDVSVGAYSDTVTVTLNY